MKNTRLPLRFRVFVLLGTAIIATPLFAQELSGPSDEAEANNPLAEMKALNFHYYYIGELTGTDDNANQLWVRYAQPFKAFSSNWLMRASLPINSYPASPTGGTETGLGDLNAFAAYLFDTGSPAVSFGLGPLLTAPTASEDVLGSGKWSAGLSNVLFNMKSPKIQYGYLITWQASFAGNDDRKDVNIGAFQPFAIYQLGKGLYLRTTGIWTYNFENDAYSMPIGLGIGQVIPKGKTVYNIFIEPQISVADDGPGQPEWQVFIGFNTQFKK